MLTSAGVAACRWARLKAGLASLAGLSSNQAAHYSSASRSSPGSVPSTSGSGVAPLTPEEAFRVAGTRVICFSAKNYVRSFLERPLLAQFPKTTFVEVCLFLLSSV